MIGLLGNKNANVSFTHKTQFKRSSKLKIVIDMNKLGPNVTHKSRWKLIVNGICLIEYAY